LVIWDNNKEVR